MNIVLISSEVDPLAKTGGLADVCAALPRELAQLGHQVCIFLPAYRSARQSGCRLRPTGVSLQIPIGTKIVEGQLLQTVLPDSNVPVYLVDQPEYFDRSGLYGERGEDYADNSERFIFFSRAVLESVRGLDLHPDVLHCNDWQSGLIPALLELEYRHTPQLENCRCLITIHNLGYQGSFWHWDMLLTGLDWKYFNWKQMEFYGQLNFLKTGIVFADRITTVSARYAEEIQTAELGCGLDGVLRHRRDDLTGIMNGIDTQAWNPQTDTHLSVHYGPGNWEPGKAGCKAHLQHQLGLDPDPAKPLIGLIGRLASQKGWSLVLPVMQQWLQTIDTQWAVLGTGDRRYHQALQRLASAHPTRMAARLEFSDELAHQIEAAADIFLMPSQYEPCGLNQLYSLRYGTVPVVRATGGLLDSIVDANAKTLADSTANGFRFDAFRAEEMETALARAVFTYLNQKPMWRQLVENGMNQDWSWRHSAKKYEALYAQMIRQQQRQPV